MVTGLIGLYRLHNADGALLYVGITSTVTERMATHERTKPWWSEVASIDIEYFATRQAALAAERAAIVSEQPRYNLVHAEQGFPPLPEFASTPGAPVYAGSQEICKMFGVSRQRAYQLTRRLDFPEPEAVLEMGKVWDKAKVRAWAAAKGREVKG